MAHAAPKPGSRTLPPWTAVRRFWRVARTIGWRAAVDLRVRGRDVAVRWPGCRHPVSIRAGTSDFSVFRQIFVRREYAPLDDLGDVATVVDLGANVGYSAIWFLEAFPACRVIAVEPDPGNFAALQRNLAPYGERAVCLRAGVWSHDCHLRLVDEPFRDGGEWARQVVECGSDEPGALRGLGLAQLLDAHGIGRVDLLKCDIEGAEVVLFGPSCASWLDRIAAIAIELHDDSMFGSGTAAFHGAIAGRGASLTQSRELTLCRFPMRPLAAGAPQRTAR